MVTKFYYVIACKGSCSTKCNTTEYLLVTGELVMAMYLSKYTTILLDETLQTLGVGVSHRGKK